jgi:hypothetical protein
MFKSGVLRNHFDENQKKLIQDTLLQATKSTLKGWQADFVSDLGLRIPTVTNRQNIDMNESMQLK